MDFIEKESLSVPEAVFAACLALGIDEKEAQVQVLSSPGARRVKVRVGKPGVAMPEGGSSQAAPAARPSAPMAPAAPAGPVAKPADYQPRRSERRQPSPEQAEQLKQDIEKMLELMGTPMQVEMKQHAGNLIYNLKGDKEGLLIGKRGMTLEALQEVVADMAATLAGDKGVYAVVDIADYRTRQESKFMDQARELAQKALAGEGQQSMGPLSPAERRVVHLELQSMEGIETFSVGEGARKKVMIQKKA